MSCLVNGFDRAMYIKRRVGAQNDASETGPESYIEDPEIIRATTGLLLESRRSQLVKLI